MLDVVTGDGSTITVLRGRGDGSFAAPVGYAPGAFRGAKSGGSAP